MTIGNDNELAVRRYAGLSLQGTYRQGSFDIGGNYTVSRNWGNFEGETVANGPIRFTGTLYPEYKDADWNYPIGDLSSDQRHRSRVWLNYNPSFAPASRSAWSRSWRAECRTAPAAARSPWWARAPAAWIPVRT